MEIWMSIDDNDRSSRVVPPDMIVVAPEPETYAKLWMVAAVAAISMFVVVFWWLM